MNSLPSVPLSPANLKQLGLGIDPNALVLKYEDRVLRAITPGREAFFSELLAHPAVEQLMADGLLLPAKKSSIRVEGFSLVLEQPLIWPVTYPFEWTPSMFKAAARNLLRLNLKLMEHGYCTEDGHLWNMLFQGSQPQFIDFSSIREIPPSGNWGADVEFEVNLTALKLMEKGFPTEARALLRHVRASPNPSLADSMVIHSAEHYKGQPLWRADLQKVCDVFHHYRKKIVHRLKRPGNKAPWPVQLEYLLEQIEVMDVSPARSTWSNYYTGMRDELNYNGSPESAERLKKATSKQEVVNGILERIRPKTVLDLACNRGLYSQFASMCGARVVGADTDELALDTMYQDSVRQNTGIHPVYLNVLMPAEATGLRERPFPSVVDRLRSELVLCLALTHHFVFPQPRQKFPQIARLLTEFTHRHLLVEFVPLHDEPTQNLYRKQFTDFEREFDWYTLDNFQAEFQKHFRHIERLESFPAGRVLLFCQDKISD